ncbi:hypothetical protein F4815DRAFT_447710 [Daldinia loculata]|nr:hypothetical protein F4815DRAFT_447710 [Daldinia loculata]
MCRNTHHASQVGHPHPQVIVTATTVPGELYSLKQAGLFLTVAEDTNNTTSTGGCCNYVGNRKRKSLAASLTELLSRPWAVWECRSRPGMSSLCQHGNASLFTASQRYDGEREREREVLELEGNHTYERNRR